MTCLWLRRAFYQRLTDRADHLCDREMLELSQPLCCPRKKRCHDCDQCKHKHRCGGPVPPPKHSQGRPKSANDSNANDPRYAFDRGSAQQMVARAATSISMSSQPNDDEEPLLAPRNLDRKKPVRKKVIYTIHDSEIDEEASEREKGRE